ncbi:hypothetical protein GGR56DRAFT_222750 [Xylariaceae sp. FL0804]|nr:hypothetical protein GGR56DRAFT_222750 [Xylariaceae sp. FL0804]
MFSLQKLVIACPLATLYSSPDYPTHSTHTMCAAQPFIHYYGHAPDSVTEAAFQQGRIRARDILAEPYPICRERYSRRAVLDTFWYIWTQIDDIKSLPDDEYDELLGEGERLFEDWDAARAARPAGRQGKAPAGGYAEVLAEVAVPRAPGNIDDTTNKAKAEAWLYEVVKHMMKDVDTRPLGDSFEAKQEGHHQLWHLPPAARRISTPRRRLRLLLRGGGGGHCRH